jgi:hypothetical protein
MQIEIAEGAKFCLTHRVDGQMVKLRAGSAAEAQQWVKKLVDAAEKVRHTHALV